MFKCFFCGRAFREIFTGGIWKIPHFTPPRCKHSILDCTSPLLGTFNCLPIRVVKLSSYLFLCLLQSPPLPRLITPVPVLSQFTGKPQLFGMRAPRAPSDCAEACGEKQTARLKKKEEERRNCEQVLIICIMHGPFFCRQKL